MKRTNHKKNIVEKHHKSNRLNKLYLGFKTRFFMLVLAFIVFFALGITFLINSLVFYEQKSVEYREKSNLNYKVYLKENEFYEEPYLGEDMIYVASLIDNINAEFNYNFISSEKLDLDFKYKIVGKLTIGDAKNENTYFKKEYLLKEQKHTSINNDIAITINEKINIDYDYYNDIANSFKMSYGLETSSYFNIYLIIEKSDSTTSQSVSDTDIMFLSIPLSEKSVDIKMDYNKIDETSTIISNSNVIIDNIIFIIIAIILIILSIIMFIKVMRYSKLIITKKNAYDKYLSRLLTEYDRLIVETSALPFMDEQKVIKIEKFQELLDVRDNLKLPIMYCSVAKHQKCYFYISHDDKIYLNVVKAIDLEKSN